MILTCDYWKDVVNEETIIHRPNWSEVENAINRLDGKLYTLIVLDNGKGLNLFIGGSSSTIIVALSSSSEHLIMHCGDDRTTILVNVGGQIGDYRKRNIISLEHAKDVAKAFFEGSDIRSIQQWDCN